MNKFKQAIAYLVSKIQHAYHATRFLIAIIFLEIPNGRYRVVSKSIRGRVCGADNEATLGGVQTDSAGTVKPVRGQEAISDKASTCDELLGFWAGDVLDRFHHSNNQRSGDTQGCSNEGLRDEPQIQQCLHSSGAWDLLEQCDRQAIMLQAMWEKQWPSDEYELFTTKMVIELCDRKDMHWDITFEDLMSLKKQGRVTIVEPFTAKKLYPPCWGLK